MQKGVQLAVCWLGAMFYFLCTAAPALAQQAAPADSSSGVVFRWINFALVVGLLVYGFRKAGPAFRARREEIARKIAEGSRAREAAEHQRREVREKLAGIDAQIAEMRTEAQRGTEAEAERIRALAKTEAETIERAAQAEIAAAERAAHLELKVLAARIAVERAEALLREEMTPDLEGGLFGAFVGQLEESTR